MFTLFYITHITLVLGGDAGILLTDKAIAAVGSNMALLTQGSCVLEEKSIISSSFSYLHIQRNTYVALALGRKAGVLLTNQTLHTLRVFLALLAQLGQGSLV